MFPRKKWVRLSLWNSPTRPDLWPLYPCPLPGPQTEGAHVPPWITDPTMDYRSDHWLQIRPLITDQTIDFQWQEQITSKMISHHLLPDEMGGVRQWDEMEWPNICIHLSNPSFYNCCTQASDWSMSSGSTNTEMKMLVSTEEEYLTLLRNTNHRGRIPYCPPKPQRQNNLLNTNQRGRRGLKLTNQKQCFLHRC